MSSASKSNSQLTRAEKAALARKEREEKDQKEKEESEQKEKERLEILKKSKEDAKSKDTKSRQKHKEVGDGLYECSVCQAHVAEYMLEDHLAEHPQQIKDRIWLGAAVNMENLEFLKAEGITHILNCTQEVELPKKVESYVKGFQRVAIQDRTTEDLLSVIYKGILWIDEVLSNEKNIILIHCREGKSRSASFLCGFLIWKENVAFESALSTVRSRRTVAMPNPKFYKQLEEFAAVITKEQELPVEKRSFPPSKYEYKLMPVKQA